MTTSYLTYDYYTITLQLLSIPVLRRLATSLQAPNIYPVGCRPKGFGARPILAYIYIYTHIIYIYIYIHRYTHNIHICIYIYREREREIDRYRYICCQPRGGEAARFAWHYLSNGTCLIRPLSFHACLVASRSAIVCYVIRHSRRKPALAK